MSRDTFRREVNGKMHKGNSHVCGNSFANGASNSQGPAVSGHMNWEQELLMASQPNQFRDGQ